MANYHGLLPDQSEAIVDPRGIITRKFRDFLADLATTTSDAALQAQITALAERVSELETDEEVIFSLLGLGSVQVVGPLEGVAYRIELKGDVDAPGNTHYYGTGPDGVKGFFRLYDALSADVGLVKTDSGYIMLGEVATVADLPGSGSIGEAWRVLDPAGLWAWDGAAWALDPAPTGVVGFRLDELADTGVGAALVKITRDAYGRVEGTEAATTDDLPEGAANLYFTDARADARITLQKGQPLGLATLDADGKLDTGQLPALAITETFVVASQVAMLALTAEEGDVAVRTDLNMSFILTAAPASTLSNWQELLTPMSPVTSVFGRVGSVTAASGDYTPAQVGADPVGSAAAAQSAAQTYADGKVAASITNGDTTHAPSGDAVFDALALKQDKAAASDFITAYGAGTVYTVTATSAAIVQGTSSPAIVLPAAGTYLIRGFARLFDSSSTHATNRNWFAVFRRTNNTAADIANSTIAWGLGIKASGSNSTVGVVQMPEIIYTTTNNNDALTIFTNLSALPDSGAYQISAAQIIAQKLY